MVATTKTDARPIRPDLTTKQKRALSIALRAAANGYDNSPVGSYGHTPEWDYMNNAGMKALRAVDAHDDSDIIRAFFEHIDGVAYAHNGGLSGRLSARTLRQAAERLWDLGMNDA